MFDKERFHNALALSLGYERIIMDKRITIEVDESEVPLVTLKFQGNPESIRIKASDASNEVNLKDLNAMHDEIKTIIDTVHQAYIEVCECKY